MVEALHKLCKQKTICVIEYMYISDCCIFIKDESEEQIV